MNERRSQKILNDTSKYPVDDILEPPSKEQLYTIKHELNEYEGKLEHNENLLQSWIKCQSRFPKNYDKRFVRNFLRNCRHNLSKAKSKLEYYFTAKNMYPELYSNRNPYEKDILRALDTICIVYLPKLTENGNKVTFFKLQDPDPSNFDVRATSKLYFMIYDLLLTAENPIAGDIAVFDATHFGPNHFVKLLSLMKMIITILRQAYSIRLKEVHVVNAAPMADKIISVFRPFLHYRIRDQFIVHSNYESLSSYISPKIMPLEYGGEYKPLKELMMDWTETLQNAADWFEAQESVKITTPVPKEMDKTFYDSVEGSFRSLQID